MKNFASIAAKDTPPKRTTHAHLQPLHLSSTYIYQSPEQAQAVFKGKAEAHIYSRWSHPNAELVEEKIAAMEGLGLNKKYRALLFNSGMAAISAWFQCSFQPGDALLVQGNIYGTTVDYLRQHAARWGLQLFFADFHDLKNIATLLKKHKSIQWLYAETPANPTLRCYNLAALASLAHTHGGRLAVDNTFASPYLQQPFAYAADVVLHSGTKYLNGHGNSLSGVLLTSDQKLYAQAWQLRKLHGSIAAPFDAWLLNSGMKTLHLRMPQHCSNAQVVAEWLSKHKAVSKVHYPGLPSHPDHALAVQQMRGFGGVLAFELTGGYRAGLRLMKRVRWCQLTASLGTTDTLIQHPASMSHYFVPPTQRKKYGITDGLVRLSVGIEDVCDVIADLQQAMK